jgi:hypothetical protein
MNITALESSSYEKGWGVFFDVRHQDQLYRFSISIDTLATPGLRHRTKRTFPEVFEANISTMLQVAELLIRSGRLEAGVDIGGTEILASHIGELTGREA